MKPLTPHVICFGCCFVAATVFVYHPTNKVGEGNASYIITANSTAKSSDEIAYRSEIDFQDEMLRAFAKGDLSTAAGFLMLVARTGDPNGAITRICSELDASNLGQFSGYFPFESESQLRLQLIAGFAKKTPDAAIRCAESVPAVFRSSALRSAFEAIVAGGFKDNHAGIKELDKNSQMHYWETYLLHLARTDISDAILKLGASFLEDRGFDVSAGAALRARMYGNALMQDPKAFFDLIAGDPSIVSGIEIPLICELDSEWFDSMLKHFNGDKYASLVWLDEIAALRTGSSIAGAIADHILDEGSIIEAFNQFSSIEVSAGGRDAIFNALASAAGENSPELFTRNWDQFAQTLGRGSSLNDVSYTFANSWASVDPVSAIGWAIENSGHKLADMVGPLAISQLPPAKAGDIVETIRESPNEFTAEFENSLLGRFAEFNPEGALEWFLENGKSEPYDAGVLVSTLTKLQPIQSLQKLSDLTASPRAASVTKEILRRWIPEEPYESSIYLSEMENSETKFFAMAQLVEYTKEYDTEAAVQWGFALGPYDNYNTISNLLAELSAKGVDVGSYVEELGNLR